MKLLIVSKYAPVPGFGSNPRWFWLGREFLKQGIEVTITVSDSNHGSSYPPVRNFFSAHVIDGVNFIVIKGIKYGSSNSFRRVLSWFEFDWKVFWLFRKNRFDMVIISSLSLTTVVFGIYCKVFKKIPFVFEVRDIWPLTLVEEGNISYWHPFVIYLRMLEKFAYKTADLIVGTMPNLKQHVLELGISRPSCSFHTCGIGILPERVADVEKFVFPDEIEKLCVGRTIVGYCGSIGLSNNLHDFVEYIHSCERDDVVFVVAGSGSYADVFKRQLHQIPNVFFVGYISPDAVQSFLRRCDILFLSTLPSKVWDYGQSMNKVVDYMLAAKYIVAQYTGHPSFINESECGVFTDGAGLTECLDAAIDMPRATRDAAGLAGREWLLEHQNYETLARDYIRKIEACL